jgi:hypothetical protein
MPPLVQTQQREVLRLRISGWRHEDAAGRRCFATASSSHRHCHGCLSLVFSVVPQLVACRSTEVSAAGRSAFSTRDAARQTFCFVFRNVNGVFGMSRANRSTRDSGHGSIGI